MRRVLTAGLMGGMVLFVWMFVVNGLLGFRAAINMKQLPTERQVYEVLRDHVTEPGRYACNPELTADWRFPEGEPVFSVLYGGMGHEAAGSLMLFGLFLYLSAPIVATWMLSQTSNHVLSNYRRKVFFFSGIGFLIAALSNLTDFGIGGYPVTDALLLAANDFIAWTLIGLTVAWRLQPEESEG